ncbi:hypothetical protein [Demequina sp.]|uniref:hypothetical protein n=1 Tax=Demequina sp. TaxID=2050685 RepID=UPI003D141D74
MAPDSEPTPRIPWLPVSEGDAVRDPAPVDERTPTKPIVPAWIQRNDEPVPVEDDDATVVAPVTPPPAEELLPSADAKPITAPEFPAKDRPDGAVQRLGNSAVEAATLSAAGAPTPLGGVPTVPAGAPITPPDFDPAPMFVPAFADGVDAQEEAAPETMQARADALAAGIVAQEQERLASQSAALDAGAAYTPMAFGATSEEAVPSRKTQPAPIGEEPAEPSPPSDQKKRKWWLWALIAIVVIGAGIAIYAATQKSDSKVVPGVTVTEPAPSPTIEPIAAPTGTDFQSALPTTVGTYSLVEATVLDPAEIALTAGRVADGVDLTYRSGDDTMTVRALQYYNEDDATTMFTEFVGEDTATTPVEAGGTTVGERAIVTTPRPGLVWRNGTSVFILEGPALQLTAFYDQFGL